ncbi:hypothetical protein PINS_up015999 [Pythium insidiosum]|nr:hypothetical protein PINS_up015999 [Pythium insidiosum]
MQATAARSAFDRELQALPDDFSHEDLLRLYSAEHGRERDGHAPAVASLQDCKFFDRFNMDIVEFNAQQEEKKKQFIKENGENAWWDVLFSGKHHDLKSRRSVDYRLSDEESERLRSNGVIVLSRIAHDSFGDAYYSIYNNDLPVFITADSILHAWHRSFDEILINTETVHLMGTLKKVLQCSLKTIQDLSSSTSADRAVLEDVEVFLSVPLQLLTGVNTDTERHNVNVKRQVNELIEHFKAGQMRNVSIFSSQRDVDFSQFTPRGHYTKSPALSKYFCAMTWLGTIDIRLWSSQSPEDPDAYLRALQRAIALTWVLREAEQLKEVNGMLELITSIVGGGSDSMTPRQLAELLPDQTEGIQLLLRDLSDSKQPLEALFTTIKDRNLGAQQIAGHPLYTEDLQSNGGLPISFAMLGQQFTLGSFVLSNVVFDNIKFKGEPVDRRVPSVSLDVGFALFGNDAAVPQITRRMGRDTSQATIVERLRDGLPYASNLVALRRTVDTTYVESPKLEQSIGDQWLGMLRHLSAKCPVASPTFHTDAWKLRQLTTQVASFTQLRHDTLLYTKQSNTAMLYCEYPAGYVEPYPEFWMAFERMVSSLAKLLPFGGAKRLS